MKKSAAAKVPIAIPTLTPVESCLGLAEEVVCDFAAEIADGDSAGVKEVAVWGERSEVNLENPGKVELVEGKFTSELDVEAVDKIGSTIENTEEFEASIVDPSAVLHSI